MKGGPDGRWNWKQLLIGLCFFILVFTISRAVSHTAPFQRISTVVADEISRALGVPPQSTIVLLRVEPSLPRKDFESLLVKAIPELLDRYPTSVLGIDIDFSSGQFTNLASSFRNWRNKNYVLADRIVWATGFKRGPPEHQQRLQMQICTGCDDAAGCNLRLIPKPVFGGGPEEPPSYGVAWAWTDASGISRSSVRFVCSAESTQRLPTFHFKLVEAYCSKHPGHAVCEQLQPNRQSTTKLTSWFDTQTLDLCSLLSCDGKPVQPAPTPVPDLNEKIVVLYRDVEGNDEHPTPVAGTRKGAEIVASLAMNELVYGASDEGRAEAEEIAIEIVIAFGLFMIFHHRWTERWAVLLSGMLFIVLLYFAPNISARLPEFRNFALAIGLAFALEVWIKAAYHDLRELVRSFRKQRDSSDEGLAPPAVPELPAH